MISAEPLASLAVSIEDVGDHWLASNRSDMGLAQLRFYKTDWDRDVISGVMLLAVGQSRLVKEEAEMKASVAEVEARPRRRGRPRRLAPS